MGFLDKISRDTQISNLMKIRPVTAEMFQAHGRTGGHDEASSHFFQIVRTRQKFASSIVCVLSEQFTKRHLSTE
jgi:hypothetical protein